MNAVTINEEQTDKKTPFIYDLKKDLASKKKSKSKISQTVLNTTDEKITKSDITDDIKQQTVVDQKLYKTSNTFKLKNLLEKNQIEALKIPIDNNIRNDIMTSQESELSKDSKKSIQEKSKSNEDFQKTEQSPSKNNDIKHKSGNTTMYKISKSSEGVVLNLSKKKVVVKNSDINTPATRKYKRNSAVQNDTLSEKSNNEIENAIDSANHTDNIHITQENNSEENFNAENSDEIQEGPVLENYNIDSSNSWHEKERLRTKSDQIKTTLNSVKFKESLHAANNSIHDKQKWKNIISDNRKKRLKNMSTDSHELSYLPSINSTKPRISEENEQKQTQILPNKELFTFLDKFTNIPNKKNFFDNCSQELLTMLIKNATIEKCKWVKILSVIENFLFLSDNYNETIKDEIKVVDINVNDLQCLLTQENLNKNMEKLEKINYYKRLNSPSSLASQSLMNTPKTYLHAKPFPAQRNFSCNNERWSKATKNPISMTYVDLHKGIGNKSGSNQKLASINKYYNTNASSNNKLDFIQMQEMMGHKVKMKVIETRKNQKSKVKKVLDENKKIEKKMNGDRGGQYEEPPVSKIQKLNSMEKNIINAGCINAADRVEKMQNLRRNMDLKRLDEEVDNLGLSPKKLKQKHNQYLVFKKENRFNPSPNNDIYSNVMKLDQKELNLQKNKHEKEGCILQLKFQ